MTEFSFFKCSRNKKTKNKKKHTNKKQDTPRTNYHKLTLERR